MLLSPCIQENVGLQSGHVCSKLDLCPSHGQFQRASYCPLKRQGKVLPVISFSGSPGPGSCAADAAHTCRFYSSEIGSGHPRAGGPLFLWEQLH